MILVTGARGKTGREVVRLLGRPVLEGSSQPGSAAPFSWDDPSAWPGDLDAVYLMRPDRPDAPDLVSGLVDRNPTAHVVLLSEQGAGDLPAGHWARRVEDAVTARAASWTLLRPSWFHQVFTDERFYRDDIRLKRVLSLPSGGGAIAWIDATDIATVAVEALLRPEHRGRAYTLTGPEALTVAAVADELSAALGETVRAEDPPTDRVVDGLDPYTTEILVDLYERVRLGGFAEVSPVVEQITGRRPASLGDFVRANVDHWRP